MPSHNLQRPFQEARFTVNKYVVDRNIYQQTNHREMIIGTGVVHTLTKAIQGVEQGNTRYTKG